MAHGGERQKSGRKPRPIERAINREKNNSSFDEKAVAALPELFETIKIIAQGYKIATYSKPRKCVSELRYDGDGDELYVYTVPPDKSAVMYLVDRAAGKSAVKPAEVSETELILEFSMPGPVEDTENE